MYIGIRFGHEAVVIILNKHPLSVAMSMQMDPELLLP